jgi:hypothetical protein
MAALTLGDSATPVDVSQQLTGIAGADLTAGMPVYLDASEGTYKPANADAAGTSGVVGLVMADSAIGAACTVLTKGIVDLDGTIDDLDFAAMVYLGTSAGGLDDTGVGQNVTIGTVVPGWASRPADKLLRIDL